MSLPESVTRQRSLRTLRRETFARSAERGSQAVALPCERGQEVDQDPFRPGCVEQRSVDCQDHSRNLVLTSWQPAVLFHYDLPDPSLTTPFLVRLHQFLLVFYLTGLTDPLSPGSVDRVENDGAHRQRQGDKRQG